MFSCIHATCFNWCMTEIEPDLSFIRRGAVLLEWSNHITKESLAEFIRLYKQEFGIDLEEGEARIAATRVLKFFISSMVIREAMRRGLEKYL